MKFEEIAGYVYVGNIAYPLIESDYLTKIEDVENNGIPQYIKYHERSCEFYPEPSTSFKIILCDKNTNGFAEFYIHKDESHEAQI